MRIKRTKRERVLDDAFKVEPLLKKYPPNVFIGLFGRTISHSSKTLFTLSPHVASKWLREKDPKSEVFIKTITHLYLDMVRVLYKPLDEHPIVPEGSHGL